MCPSLISTLYSFDIGASVTFSPSEQWNVTCEFASRICWILFSVVKWNVTDCPQIWKSGNEVSFVADDFFLSKSLDNYWSSIRSDYYIHHRIDPSHSFLYSANRNVIEDTRLLHSFLSVRTFSRRTLKLRMAKNLRTCIRLRLFKTLFFHCFKSDVYM